MQLQYSFIKTLCITHRQFTNRLCTKKKHMYKYGWNISIALNQTENAYKTFPQQQQQQTQLKGPIHKVPLPFVIWLRFPIRFFELHHHIRFIVCFPCLHGLGGLLWKHSKLCPKSLAMSLLNFFLSDHFWLQLPLTWKVLHLLDQAFSSFLSRWPNHYRLISC